jgi:hypothetical protein
MIWKFGKTDIDEMYKVLKMYNKQMDYITEQLKSESSDEFKNDAFGRGMELFELKSKIGMAFSKLHLELLPQESRDKFGPLIDMFENQLEEAKELRKGEEE